MSRDWNSARLVFVCAGNICRSPMAVGLARAAFAKRGYEPVIISMGTIGATGAGADSRAVEVMGEVGVDITTHRAQKLNATMLNAADFAFGMAAHHVEAIRGAGAGAFRAARLLPKFATPPRDEIPDPVRGTIEDFRVARDVIAECIEAWCARFVDGG